MVDALPTKAPVGKEIHKTGGGGGGGGGSGGRGGESGGGLGKANSHQGLTLVVNDNVGKKATERNFKW